jgi:rhamnose transport system permease protein
MCGGALFEFALFILLAAAFAFLLHKTNFGRRTYAIGNNPTGAWFPGSTSSAITWCCLRWSG